MYKLTKISFVLFFLLLSRSIFASSISIEKLLPADADISVGDEILINLSLASEGKVQNALEGSLSIGSNLEILSVVTGNSIVSIWVENPANFSGQNIKFSGIIPAGYNNESGQVFSVVLRAKEIGTSNIILSDASTFLNDGLGTKTSVSDKTFSLNIKKAVSGKEPYKISVKDINPPEDFKVQLLKEDNLFGGKWALVFTGRDLGSGIKEYEVSEGHKVFKQVTSPYLLENQHLNEKIYVRAIDNEGNVKIVKVKIPNKFCIGVKCFDRLTFGIVIAVIIVIIWFLKRKRLRIR